MTTKLTFKAERPSEYGLTHGTATPLEGHTITRTVVTKRLRWVVDQRSRWRPAHYSFSCTCGWSGGHSRTDDAANAHMARIARRVTAR